MKATSTNAKSRGGRLDCTDQNSNSKGIFAELLESIKAELFAGRDVRLIDYPHEKRHLVIGAMAQLRDEYPIIAGWQTIRESHLSQTRLRARRYSIPGEFLREVGHE